MGQSYMVGHMKKTTLNIDEAIMTQLKEEAIRRKTTMGALVEAGIRRILGEGQTPAPGAVDLPPLPTANMGEALVDIADREALYEVLDRERDTRLYGTPATPAVTGAARTARPKVLAVAEEPAPYDASGGAPDGTDEA